MAQLQHHDREACCGADDDRQQRGDQAVQQRAAHPGREVHPVPCVGEVLQQGERGPGYPGGRRAVLCQRFGRVDQQQVAGDQPYRGQERDRAVAQELTDRHAGSCAAAESGAGCRWCGSGWRGGRGGHVILVGRSASCRRRYVMEATNTSRVRNTATAAPEPNSWTAKVSRYIVTARVSERRPGPPSVIVQMMSNVFRLVTIESTLTTVVSVRSSGQIMYRNIFTAFSPSIRAASITDRGIACS